MNPADATECAVCGKEANQRCAKCHSAFYCGKQHQVEHWKTHKKVCSPYSVHETPELGRHLKANVDIAAGTVILKQAPLVLGPRQVTPPVCLACFTPCDTSFVCPVCGWPLCDEGCLRGMMHFPECKMTRTGRGKPLKIAKSDGNNPMYEALTTMRCLWLKEGKPDQWEAISKMQGHKHEAGTVEHNQKFVADFIRKHLKLTMFSNEDIHNVLEIIDTNGFELPGLSCVALYDKAYLLEHNCVPNTSRTFDERLSIIIRAAVDIPKGGHITTSYTDPLWGTTNRQLHLSTTKQFNCVCERCSSCTELATHLSSLRCSSCENGAVLQLAPPNGESWKCDKCSATLEQDAVNKILNKIGEKLVALPNGEVGPINSFLRETSTELSATHYYRADAAMNLLQLLEVEPLTLDKLQQMEVLCRQFLSVADIVNPGLSRLRGTLHYNLSEILQEKYRKMAAAGKPANEVTNVLKETAESLSLAERILGFESPLQLDFQLSQRAKDDLVTVNKLLAKAK